jgi:hypothetical protein
MTYEDLKAGYTDGRYRGYGEITEALTVLFQHIAEQEGRLLAQRAMTEQQHRRIVAQTKHIDSMERLVTPPDCADCTGEMVLDQDAGLYTCDCHGSCTCENAMGCAFCNTVVDSGDYFENFHEIKEDNNRYWKRSHKEIQGRQVEQGPSAAAAAKPVTPKFVMTIQSGDWDGLENL